MQKIEFQKLEELDFKANESFKTLRSNIVFCGNDIHSITLTSFSPNEGKTSVSFQLAISFAEIGKKVLFIDADIRKSVLVSRYKASGEIVGLTHYLTGQKSIDDIVYATNIPNLEVIFSGPVSPNPTELLGGMMFKDLMEQERENYDYIIVDAPPLGSVIDAALIAKCADGAVIVIESGAVSYKMIQRVKTQLDKSECRILGVILNKVDMKSNAYYGNYYGSYYGNYE